MGGAGVGQEDGTGAVCDGGEGDGRVGVGAGGPPKWEADIPVTPGTADMLWFQHTPGHAGEWLSSAGFGGSPPVSCCASATLLRTGCLVPLTLSTCEWHFPNILDF